MFTGFGVFGHFTLVECQPKPTDFGYMYKERINVFLDET